MAVAGVRPRKEETDAIAEILQSDKFETPAKMANAVLARAYELFQDREWFVVAMRNDGHNLLFGQYGTEGAAEKAIATNNLGVFGTTAVFPVHSFTKRAAYLTAMDEPTVARKDCARCGHLQAVHGLNKKTDACGSGCPCPGFTKEGSS